jgi:hypothetical protein
MHRRATFAGISAILLLAAGSHSAIAQATANDQATILYTEFPAEASKPVLTKPPAAVGTVEYNKWLGQMFNGVLFNESSPQKEKEIAEQIVDEEYLQHNKLVATGRKGATRFHALRLQGSARHALHRSRRLRHKGSRRNKMDVDRHAHRRRLSRRGAQGTKD